MKAEGVKVSIYKDNKWQYSIKQNNVKYGTGLIVINGMCHTEEILWWFSFGNKPTPVEALYNIFTEFQFLEEHFKDSEYSSLSFDTENSYNAITLWQALEEAGETNNWEERERVLEVWTRIEKLYHRMDSDYGAMFIQDSEGLGKQRFNELKELLNNTI